MPRGAAMFVLPFAALILAGLSGGTSRPPGAPLFTLPAPRVVVAAPEPAQAVEEQADGEREDFGAASIRFRRRQMQNEHHRIPRNAIVRAARHVARARRSPARSAAHLAGIDRSGWTWLGPGNVGGRTRAIVIDPTTPATMWAGTASGGIWKTTNGGTRWFPLDDFVASLRVSTLVIDPLNHDVLYAGTGESFTIHRQDNIPGAGVFRSADGGATWSQLPATSGWSYVNRLSISPADAQVLLAATGDGIYRTTNGGTNWSLSLAGAVTDVDLAPSGASAIAGWNGGAGYSTNGGVDWTAATGLVAAGRVEVAYARSQPSIVYASVASNAGEVWKSTDGGQSYVLVNSGRQYLSSGSYANALWVDPTNPSTMIVGGLDLWRSTDGGTTLTQISDWDAEQSFGTSAHADQHAIVEAGNYDGSTVKTVYFGNDGGVYRASDVSTVSLTSGWTRLDNNFGATQFYSGTATPNGLVFGGTQDNGTRYDVSGTENWGSVFGGDGGMVAADPADANYLYGEYVYLRIFRNTSGGPGSGSDYIAGDYAQDGSCLKSAPYVIPDSCGANGGGANFIAPFVLDPGNANRILAGGLSLWRTDDAKTANTQTTGPSWTSIKPAVGSGSPISAIAVAPTSSDVVWVGYNNGLIYRSANATAVTPTWQRVDTNAMPARFVLDITIDPRDPNLVYATFGGFAADNVYRTPDAGVNWAPWTGTGLTSLPAAPIRSLVVHPTNSSILYAGTDVGVEASEDGGATWSPAQAGPANVSVDQLFWAGGTTLVAATHGRGMWSIDVSNVPPANDNLADAVVLSGTSVTRTTDTNVAATKESGEPAHAGNPGGGSVWYSWTPSADGAVVLDTAGSTAGAGQLDTLLAVYTGGAVDALTAVASNDDAAQTTYTSSLTFPAVAGTTYLIAVDGYRNDRATVARGTVHLNLVESAGGTQPVTVTSAGSGSGAVTSSPAGIDCGATCSASFATASTVVLTAAPAVGSTFDGWSGDCTGTATCSLTMDAARSVTATFTSSGPTTYPATVTLAGTGAGGVTSSPAGIDCGVTCTASFSSGASVVLTAAPDASSTFDGWSGACSGTGPCSLTMNGDRSVTATFTQALTYSVAVTLAGAGGGSVASNPAGIACPGTCAGAFAQGGLVTLTATADAGSVFAGWTGDCSGTKPCNLTVNGDRSVTATFSPPRPANDDFATAVDLAGASGVRAADSTVGATREVGEPRHVGNDGGASIWYRLVPSQTGVVAVVTAGSSFDTLLAAYTGASLDALVPVPSGSNDDVSLTDPSSAVAFVALAGETYLIAVDGFSTLGAGAPATGQVHLAWQLFPDTTPPTGPTRIASTSHHPFVRALDRTVDVGWSGATDADTAVDGYSFSWGRTASGEADTIADVGPTTSRTTSPPLKPGTWYFHLRTGDLAGNWSGTETLGPFVIATRCVVPDVRRLTLRAASTRLRAARCRPGKVTYAFRSGVRSGSVVSQSPRKGAIRFASTRVSLVVSLGAR